MKDPCRAGKNSKQDKKKKDVSRPIEPRREGVRMGPTFQTRGGRRLLEATRVVRSVMDEPTKGHSGSRWVATPVVGLELYRGTTRTGSPV